ncbi:MAG: hypothetical protein FWE67_00275 [Planctomycetaceae bacterium]|nr:hypothetical protein [Planctomycetaceae bacterium]
MKEGKTKTVEINDNGTITLRFKDAACGENGKFDPGANQVGLVIEGMGSACLQTCVRFLTLLEDNGVPTHYESWNPNEGTMTCKNLRMLPIEFIWRDLAWGSFCKMYGIPQGYHLNGLIEATLKSDELGDPRINQEAAVRCGFLTDKQYEECAGLIRSAGTIIRQEMLKYGYCLVDFKLEFGETKDGRIVLGDEVSPAVWRVLKDGKPVDPIECAKRIIETNMQM